MPVSFKNGARWADAVTVSDTVVNEATNGLLLDGDAPRLGTSAAPMLPNVPPAATFSNVDSGPTLPVVSQVLTDGSAPTLPTLPVPATAAPAHTAEPTVEAESGEPRHPMAHLMPEKIKPTEASLRAAEARAAKKKKAKKIKIIVSICVVVVTAVVGPPLVKWTINAVNEAGSTKKDAPTEQPAPAPAPADPQATPSAGHQAIDDAKALTSATTVPATP